MPLLAALVGGAVAWQSFADRGPLVEIRFSSGAGVQAGKTEIRHKDVVVGEVEDVLLTEDLDAVTVVARLDKVMAPYLGDTTRFWIVSARVDGSQISGLSTLFSGSYIEVDWAETPEVEAYSFEGLDVPPLTSPGTPGKRLTLKSDRTGSLDVGSPVYFRQLQVGRIERRRLTDDAAHIVFDAFIDAPYHEQIDAATRFWNVSGIDMSAGARGFKVHIETVEALLSGGIAFQSIGPGLGEPVPDSQVDYWVFEDREAAQDSLFRNENDESHRFIAEFDESVGGLNVGAPVEYDGIRVGEVVDIVYDASHDHEVEDRLYAVLQFQPARLGMSDLSLDELRRVFMLRVERGLRAQLESANLLTGAVSVRLIELRHAETQSIDFAAEPYPSIPTVPSDTQAATQDILGLIREVSRLPLQDLVAEAADLLGELKAVAANPALDAAPGELLGSLEVLSEMMNNLDEASSDLPGLLANLKALSNQADDVLSGFSPDSEIYVELAGAVRDLRTATHSIAGLAEQLEAEPNSIILGR